MRTTMTGAEFITRTLLTDPDSPELDTLAQHVQKVATGSPDVVTVEVERYRLTASPGRVGRTWTWAYNYTVSGGQQAQYGTGLAPLRRMLRRRYPNATIRENWAH